MLNESLYSIRMRETIEKELEASKFSLMAAQLLIEEDVYIHDRKTAREYLNRIKKHIHAANRHRRNADKLTRQYVRTMRKFNAQ